MQVKTHAVTLGWAAVVLPQFGIALAAQVAYSKFGMDVLPMVGALAGCLALMNVGIWLSYRRLRALNESARRLGLLADMNVRVNREILDNQEIELIYSTVLNYLFNVFNKATTGSVLVLSKDGFFTFAASRGFSEEFVSNFRLNLSDTFLYQLTDGEMNETRLISSDDFLWVKTVLKPETWKYQSVISAPIYVGSRLFGLLNVDSPVHGTYASSDVDIVDRFRTQIEIILLARERYTENIKRYQVDALTGLLTRRYFEDLFKLNLERAIRHKESFVLAMFDVDRLKVVNDTFGHLAGDQMLLAIANALRSVCRSSDIMGRLGGDEFIAYYPLSASSAMNKTLSGVRSTVRASHLRFNDVKHRPSFSYGLASFPEDGTDLKSLIAIADSRLYGMKSKKAPSFRDTLPFNWD